MPKNDVATNDQLLKLLDDLLEKRSSEWWTEFYSDPHRKCPFFTKNPNQDLIELVENGEIVPPSKVFELGCGNGRNSNYLSDRGFEVEAIDFSETAIAIARENSLKTKNSAEYYCRSIFDFDYSPESYDFIYDSGCFHHIAPHRRPDFLAILRRALKRGGIFAMNCFAPGGGSDYTDLEVYEKRSLGGGLSFPEESLKKIFSDDFHDLQIRRMTELPENGGVFGKDFLWAVKMKRN